MPRWPRFAVVPLLALSIGTAPARAEDKGPSTAAVNEAIAKGRAWLEALAAKGFTDEDEQTRTWERLPQDAHVVMPLGDQFWGRFGMLTDKSGVSWMLNLEPPRS